MNKICKICGLEKPLEAFYKLSKARSNKGDGHDYRCKDCVKTYMHSKEQLALARIRDANRRKKPEVIAYRKEYDKKYSQTETGKLNRKLNRKRYNKTEYGKEKNRERSRIFQKTENYKKAIEKYRSLNPEKRKAQIEVMKAINTKKLIRPSVCSVCNKTCTPHGHHYDYSKPLSVIWLCHDCHVAIHWHD
jgi:hypothetical protein